MTRKIFTSLILAALFALPVAAETPQGWTDNFQSALAQAQAEGKHVLVDFTGSNWCGWCIKLDKEVFSTPVFKSYAAKNWVLVYIDFPRQGRDGYYEVRDSGQNDSLKNKYQIRGFPSILLLDAEGNKIGQTGYKRGGPDNYIAHLDGYLSFQKEMKSISTKVQTLTSDADKARAHNDLVKKAAELGALGSVVESMKTAFELDTDNTQGIALENAARLIRTLLPQGQDVNIYVEAVRKWDSKNDKGHLTGVVLIEISTLAQSGQAEQAAQKAQQFDQSGMVGSGEKAQAFYLQVGTILGRSGDKASMATWYRKGHDAAPDTREGKGVKAWMQKNGLWQD